MIFVCKDVNKWHMENYKLNKTHYPLIAKYTSVRLVNFFQNRGAKIHFNQYYDENKNVSIIIIKVS